MKLPCSVIKDLLPLYVEELEQAETKGYMLEHLGECESCKNEAERLQSNTFITTQNNITPFKKIKATLRKKQAIAIIFAVLLTLTFLLLDFRYLGSPNPVRYNTDLLSFNTTENGSVFVTINAPHSATYLDSFVSEEHGGRVYLLSVYANHYNGLHKTNINETTLHINPNGEKVANIYYNTNDGTDNILVYVDNTLPSGTGFGEFDIEANSVSSGTVTLPRLALKFYTILAAVLAIILVVLVLISRKKAKLQAFLLKLFYLPLSYLIATFSVKGGELITFNLQFDLNGILIATVLIYALCILAELLIRKRKV